MKTENSDSAVQIFESPKNLIEVQVPALKFKVVLLEHSTKKTFATLAFTARLQFKCGGIANHYKRNAIKFESTLYVSDRISVVLLIILLFK